MFTLKNNTLVEMWELLPIFAQLSVPLTENLCVVRRWWSYFPLNSRLFISH